MPLSLLVAPTVLSDHPPLDWLSWQVKLGVPGKGQEVQWGQHLRGPPPGFASYSRAGEGTRVGPCPPSFSACDLRIVSRDSQLIWVGCV